MPRNEERARSVTVRKALRDVSNGNGGGRFSKSVATAKKKDKEEHSQRPRVEEEEEEENEEDRNDDALDRLLLVQSDLSSLINQIDELVVQAFKSKSAAAAASNEVESFTHFLSEMISSLKPWVPRFQRALSTPMRSAVNGVESGEIESPEQDELDSLISPSPLVSWRADCTIERGRHLFMLTPLPISKSLSSKPPMPSKSLVFERVTSNNTTDRLPFFNLTFEDTNDDLLECVTTKATPSKPSDSVATETGGTLESGFVSTPMFSKRRGSMVVNVMTPCLKMSPPKSCVLLEPVSESPDEKSPPGCKGLHGVVRRSTPFPVGFSNYSDSSGSEASEDLAFRYPELLALKKSYKPEIRKKDVEASPDWCMSPPKTCVLLEPPDEKSSDNAATDCHLPVTSCLLDKQVNLSLSNKNDGQGGSSHQTKTTCPKEPVGGSFALIESTPIWKEPERVVRTGKHPGENTLKRELWTKFEAASTNELCLNDFGTHKGFLDRLDEASCDGQ